VSQADSVIVLGIDPGTAMTGYGIVTRDGSRLRAVDYGCFETIPDRSLPERLLLIHEAVEDLIETHRPGWIGVERLYFGRNVQTAFAVGQARVLPTRSRWRSALHTATDRPPERPTRLSA
jgi:crossover junction endodeoxyribonuclease RuvC